MHLSFSELFNRFNQLISLWKPLFLHNFKVFRPELHVFPFPSLLIVEILKKKQENSNKWMRFDPTIMLEVFLNNFVSGQFHSSIKGDKLEYYCWIYIICVNNYTYIPDVCKENMNYTIEFYDGSSHFIILCDVIKM